MDSSPQGSAAPAGNDLERFASPTFTIRKQILSLIGAKFWIYDHADQCVFFTKMKGFKLKEDIRLYADESMGRELLTIGTEQVIDFSAGYWVHDPVAGETVGHLKRRGMKSLVRDEWEIQDAGQNPIGVILEDSTTLALIRRFIDSASFLLPQKYHVEVGGRTVATFQQQFNPIIQRMRVDFSADTEQVLDPRLGLGAAVLMAAIEGRQE